MYVCVRESERYGKRGALCARERQRVYEFSSMSRLLKIIGLFCKRDL